MQSDLLGGSELLTIPETAALLRLKPSTIRAWMCQRKIAFVKLGRLVRIKRKDAEAVIAAGVVPVGIGVRGSAL